MKIRPMQERNQIVVGILGTVIALVVVLMAMNLQKLPGVNPTDSYHAEFANADGLKSGDDVRVEGINVGKVSSVKVAGDHVDVKFTVQSGLKLGDTSNASIEVATVLGSLFMQVESAGTGQLSAGGTIPVARTTVPYTIIGALDQFGEFSNNTDLPKLRDSLSTLAQTMSGIAPADAKAALKGLASVSQTVAANQQQITDVLQAANTITSTLNSNSASLVGLLTQADAFLKLLQQRHQVITQLLTDTASLGNQLSILIGKNGAQLTGLFANLNTVTAVLVKQKDDLQTAIVNLGQFSVNITNATGAGPWLDLLTPTAVVPDNQIVACGRAPKPSTGPCG
ncbi:MAG: MCE family protein [Jatrophihabitantaceae bacterium]